MPASTTDSTRAASDNQAAATPSLPRIPTLPPIDISNQRPHPPSARGSAGGLRHSAYTHRSVNVSTTTLTSQSEPSTDEPQRPPNQDYMLTVNDYRSRIRNHHDVIQLCNLAKRQHSVDRINWINSLEVQVDKLRQEIEQKENEIFQRFAELNSASLVRPSRIIPRAPDIILSQYIRMSGIEPPLHFQSDDRRNPDVKRLNVHTALLSPVLILVTHQPDIPVASVSPQLIGSLIAPTIAAVAVGGTLRDIVEGIVLSPTCKKTTGTATKAITSMTYPTKQSPT
ncbi:hypothetical protein HYPSUDRAFT_197822 [Hypholoma sublateritium FD-334 SS-4]|uniref:Uncharacterized protein n=1 Tax=Hypholoma sublateritium (strain FD-334 SS-4) TaxID=945553 RepID=A0A0D2P9Q5_HYPSF|nr:hypothetical protein HYPSUDRAFT_197822 [Hypholoma sublateritium FD-334 SS-4]